jgi:hypothetical protein
MHADAATASLTPRLRPPALCLKPCRRTGGYGTNYGRAAAPGDRAG